MIFFIRSKQVFNRPVAISVAGLFFVSMRNHISVITKTHAVSCDIGIAYTVTSYIVSNLLHNYFQIVNFGDIRDIEVQTRHFLISICYTKENKFPKRTEAESKENQPRETITRDNLGSTTFHT